jgi:hypothetical protein
MKIRFIHIVFTYCAFSLVVALTSCDHYFGKKTKLDFIDTNIRFLDQVAYVPILPIIEGFVNPIDIAVGYDELIYVVDAGANEIVSFDESGRRLARFELKGVKSVVQDRTLDLLAIATFDTLGETYDAIYRIELKNEMYGLSTAKIESKMVHPFYFKNTVNSTDKDVKINAVGVMADNSYYVSRSGPTTTIFGSDNAILLFTSKDKFITPIQFTTSIGSSNDFVGTPKALVSLANPPQNNSVSQSKDFVFSSVGANTALKIKYISVLESDGGTTYFPKNLEIGDTSKADGFLNTPSKFAMPYDIAFAGDGSNNMWIIDSEKDSLFQFTNTGLEGVRPPAASQSKKNIKVSFGGKGNGPLQFNSPKGVTYSNKIVYVADAGNQRVLRFKLTTDL